MNEALQPPKLERTPITPPRPMSLELADKPIQKGKRVDFADDMVKAIALFAAKTELDAQIKELGKKALATKDTETLNVIDEEMADLNEQLAGITESLAKLRPEYGDENALNKLMEDPMWNEAAKTRERMIATTLKKKNDLEERANKLKGALRLDKAEHQQVVGKNAKRSGELEAQMRIMEDELGKTEERRLKAWSALAELDPKTYAADAALEASLAVSKSEAFRRKTEQDIADVLASLRDDINET